MWGSGKTRRGAGGSKKKVRLPGHRQLDVGTLRGQKPERNPR